MTLLTHAISGAPTYLASLLEALLFGLAIRKKLYRYLIFFVIYIFLLVPREIFLLYLSHTEYFRTLWSSYAFYISDAVLNLLRLLVIVEIGIRTLRGYPAVWHSVWRILLLICSVLILGGTLAATRHAHVPQQLILTVDQYLNSSQTLLLLVVLAIGIYYRVDVPQLFRSIVTGICIYAAVQIVNSELGRYVADPSNSAFDLIQRYSFTLMLFVWVKALWKWTSTAPQAPRLISQTEYDRISPQVHDRLRELNDRLAGLTKYQ
ncbi:MAG: hypothetical protein WAM91_12275 [Candidatus Acidiferrales bacterium]